MANCELSGQNFPGRLNMFLTIIIILLFFIYFSQRELYFDNNATVYPPGAVIASMMANSWHGNPSAYYNNNEIIDKLKSQVMNYLNATNHRCIITSGASESNNLLFRGYRGNVYCSNVEHKTSLLTGCNVFAINQLPQCEPNSLISVMAVNNETGDLFDIESYANWCRANGHWFHTDMAQYFGKYTNALSNTSNVCFSISFHKIGGPVGIGCLIVPKNFPLVAQISGTQNDGLRGGTESVALCSGAMISMQLSFCNRDEKNNHLKMICEKFIAILSRYRKQDKMSNYLGLSEMEAYNVSLQGENKFVLISMDSKVPGYQRNTVLVSFINTHSFSQKNKNGSRFCNIKFREEMTKRNVKLSIGSACNVGVQGASHVLKAMKLPFIVRCGVIRFSFGDSTSIVDLWEFERRCRDLLY